MIEENQKIWESYQDQDDKITLNQIYDDISNIPENEALAHEIGWEDGDFPLPILTFSPEQLSQLKTYQGDITVWEAYQKFAEKDQKSIVQKYRFQTGEMESSYFEIDVFQF